MAENRRGKDNRFYFSRGQMVLLGGAFTFAAVLIFILGIFVGKILEENKVMKQEEPLVKIPVNPTRQGAAGTQAPTTRDEITFNSSATKSAGAEASAPARAMESKTVERAVKAEPKEVPAASKAEAAAERVASTKSEKTPPLNSAATKSAADLANEMKEKGVIWRAQVNAFPDDRSADQLVERLKNKGYNAYKTQVENRGKTWYRVSVGRFHSRAEAEKTVETLRTKENLPKAFAASK
jgi:cell division septation protein DedD